jgi:SAM-dependent methyltransferase
MLLSINENLDKKELMASVKSVYNTIYTEHDYHPTNSTGCWSIVSRIFPRFKEALDVGCGIGYGIAEARTKMLNVYGCDIADLRRFWKELHIEDYCQVAPAHSMPYKTGRFDVVVCSDVLEHIPEKMVLDTLNEIRRVGNLNFFFHICSHVEDSVNNLYDKGICLLHITIKPGDWWKAQLEEAGFNVLGMNTYDNEPGLFDFTASKEKNLVEVKTMNFTVGNNAAHLMTKKVGRN